MYALLTLATQSEKIGENVNCETTAHLVGKQVSTVVFWNGSFVLAIINRLLVIGFCLSTFLSCNCFSFAVIVRRMVIRKSTHTIAYHLVSEKLSLWRTSKTIFAKKKAAHYTHHGGILCVWESEPASRMRLIRLDGWGRSWEVDVHSLMQPCFGGTFVFQFFSQFATKSYYSFRESWYIKTNMSWYICTLSRYQSKGNLYSQPLVAPTAIEINDQYI